MKRRITIGIVAASLALGVLAAAAQQGFTITGRVGATDQEAQEGYFALDSQTMIVVRPGSELHSYLRARVGQRIRVEIQTDTGSE